MDEFLEIFSGTGIVSITVRLLLAAVSGGVIGFGRERRRQAAGFRTYMLVGVGSALVMLTNIFLGERYGATDLARMPAAVLTGLGFLGAGAITVTHNQNVRGLTTAAGLWTTAAMGIAFGAGFYLGGFVCLVLTLVIMLFMERVSHRIARTPKYVVLYIEMQSRGVVGQILAYAAEKDIKITDFDVANDGDPDSPSKISGKFSLDVSYTHDVTAVMGDIAAIDGVLHTYRI